MTGEGLVFDYWRGTGIRLLARDWHSMTGEGLVFDDWRGTGIIRLLFNEHLTIN